MNTKTTRTKGKTETQKHYAARLCRKADHSMRKLASYIAAVAVTASPEQMSEECARMLAKIIGVKLKPGEHTDYKLFLSSLDLLFKNIGNAIEDKILSTLAVIRYMEAEERRKANKKAR